MLRNGHLGLALLVLSLLGVPFGFGPDNCMICIIIVGAALSSLPDIDIKTGMIHHRGITHTLLFALIAGICAGIIFGYFSGFIWGIIGFISGFSGVVLHLLGDIMTFHKFRPLYPFNNREIGYGFFPANSESANNGFLMLGSFAFVFYLVISSGVF
jgi:inner membrane protein